ncbi:hypothetical protein ACU4GH_20670 [Bradyrhizobium betae]|uniref:hypothetical protein n=1 Tax=Bradyrhizobium betae TaxID=244734 RepID=UPI003D67A4A5
MEALDEVKRMVALCENAGPRCNQEEILRMLEFVVDDPALTRAVQRLRLRARLRLVG